MDIEVLDALHENAEKHWWNRGRRRIVLSLLRKYSKGKNNLILDLGCGVGNHLEHLGRFGEVWGADPSPRALDYCRRVFSGRLDRVILPEQVPYAEGTFDVIVMLDVLEHIEDDAAALRKVRSLLKPGGMLVLTVPALRWMWSSFDVHAHHFRRYHRKTLQNSLTNANFLVKKLSYYNCFLFPLMAMSRICMPARFWNERKMIQRGNGPVFGRLFEAIFSAERFFLKRARLPIGGSLIAVGTRTTEEAAA